MGQLSGNSCNIITLLPLGLDCDSINASTPDATNGYVALYITGGTPPYNVTWDNGSHGTLLTNLSPGEYTATVVDYYGDFTATTTCSVGFDSFYLEEFQNCKDNSIVYYLADIPSIFTSGKTYNLTTQQGCWVSSGTTLYTNQTFIDDFAAIQNGPFDDCVDCETPPPPPVPLPSNLCMNIAQYDATILVSLQQVNFSSGTTINGYQSWTSSTPSYTMYYNTGNTRWEVSGWTSSGIPNFPFPVDYPEGTWIVSGSYSKQITVVSGTCVSPPLRFRITKDDPSCASVNDGSITINVQSGTPPYSYSLDGVNYQNSPNVFFGLGANNYLVYVKDSLNNVATLPVTLNNTSNVGNYTLNLQTISVNTVPPINTSLTNKRWVMSVPSLPNNKTVSFTINLSAGVTATTNPSTISMLSQLKNDISGYTTGTATLSAPTTLGYTTNSVFDSVCKGDTYYTAFTNTYSATITGNGTVILDVLQKVFTPPSTTTRCPAFGKIRDSITITNVSINPQQCSTVTNNTTPNTIETTRTGIVLES